MTNLIIPLALYIHLPFCRSKCAYCDFVSYSGKDEMIPSYISQILKEWHAINAELIHPNSTEITSCYIGGGTPSLLSEREMEDLVNGLFPEGVPSGMEFSIESNPESLTISKLTCYRDLGINRISLGVQSFNDETLKQLGRVHTADQAVEAIAMIQGAGFENHSIDLMYGLPDQSPSDLARDLTLALSIHIPHFSAYCLKVSPSTPFGKLISEGRLMLPSEERIIEMMDILEEMALQNGFKHYETSNFARPGFACRHNMTYWHLETYIGLGLGAISYFTEGCGQWGAHWENPTTFQEYREASSSVRWPFMNRDPLSRKAAFMETLLAGLRLKEGVEIDRLESRFGRGIVEAMFRKVEPLVEAGWLELKGGSLKVTVKGGRILDALIIELVSDIE